MSIFHRAMDRLADFIWTGRKATLRFTAEYRTACYAVPLINKLLTECEDGDTYRTALIEWHRAERPPLALYRGDVSMCRIDGPRQLVEDELFALGSLIQSPGVTAHLDPIETRQLEARMRAAIEAEILHWIDEHKLQERPPVEATVNREVEDPKAMARITDWLNHNRWAELHSYIK